MLWTIVPLDVLMDDEEATSTAEMSVGGATVVLDVDAEGVKRVQRLLSTNPAHYLRREWQPGTVWTDPDLSGSAQINQSGRGRT